MKEVKALRYNPLKHDIEICVADLCEETALVEGAFGDDKWDYTFNRKEAEAVGKWFLKLAATLKK